MRETNEDLEVGGPLYHYFPLVPREAGDPGWCFNKATQASLKIHDMTVRRSQRPKGEEGGAGKGPGYRKAGPRRVRLKAEFQVSVGGPEIT